MNNLHHLAVCPLAQFLYKTEVWGKGEVLIETVKS